MREPRRLITLCLFTPCCRESFTCFIFIFVFILNIGLHFGHDKNTHLMISHYLVKELGASGQLIEEAAFTRDLQLHTQLLLCSNRNVQTRIHKSLKLNPASEPAESIPLPHILFFKIRFNIILAYTSMPSESIRFSD
jgi:hypothetical protein